MQNMVAKQQQATPQQHDSNTSVELEIARARWKAVKRMANEANEALLQRVLGGKPVVSASPQKDGGSKRGGVGGSTHGGGPSPVGMFEQVIPPEVRGWFHMVVVVRSVCVVVVCVWDNVVFQYML